MLWTEVEEETVDILDPGLRPYLNNGNKRTVRDLHRTRQIIWCLTENKHEDYLPSVTYRLYVMQEPF